MNRPEPPAPILPPSFCPCVDIPPYTHTDQRHCHRTRSGGAISAAVVSNQSQTPRKPTQTLRPGSHHPLPAEAKAFFSFALLTALLDIAIAAVAHFYVVYTCIRCFLATPASVVTLALYVVTLALYPALTAPVFSILCVTFSLCLSVGLLCCSAATSAPTAPTAPTAPSAPTAPTAPTALTAPIAPAAAAAPTNALRPSARRLVAAAGAELGARNVGVDLADVEALSLTRTPRVACPVRTRIVVITLEAFPEFFVVELPPAA